MLLALCVGFARRDQRAIRPHARVVPAADEHGPPPQSRCGTVARTLGPPAGRGRSTILRLPPGGESHGRGGARGGVRVVCLGEGALDPLPVKGAADRDGIRDSDADRPRKLLVVIGMLTGCAVRSTRDGAGPTQWKPTAYAR